MLKSLLEAPGVIVQGITGRHGSFHTAAMLEAGTKVVAGVKPGRGGSVVHGVPVFDTVQAAVEATGARVSVVFVPAAAAKGALMEAIEAGIGIIVCITEGVPVHDMVAVLERARARGAAIIGPNCPGVLIPDLIKLGIIPASVGMPGRVGLVSRSGTLTYEAAASLTAAGVGQRWILGIGGDQLHGVSFTDALAVFEDDSEVDQIVLIGEIGGADEQLAAEYIRGSVRKPVFGYVVGQSAVAGQQLGHAGAIMGGVDESAGAKAAALKDAGVTMAMSLPELVGLVLTTRA